MKLKIAFRKFFCTRLSEIIKKALKDRESPLREFNTTYKSRFMQKSYINGKNLLHWNMQCTLEYERPGSALTCVFTFFLQKAACLIYFTAIYVKFVSAILYVLSLSLGRKL